MNERGLPLRHPASKQPRFLFACSYCFFMVFTTTETTVTIQTTISLSNVVYVDDEIYYKLVN